MITHLINKSKS